MTQDLSLDHYPSRHPLCLVWLFAEALFWSLFNCRVLSRDPDAFYTFFFFATILIRKEFSLRLFYDLPAPPLFFTHNPSHLPPQFFSVRCLLLFPMLLYSAAPPPLTYAVLTFTIHRISERPLPAPPSAVDMGANLHLAPTYIAGRGTPSHFVSPTFSPTLAPLPRAFLLLPAPPFVDGLALRIELMLGFVLDMWCLLPPVLSTLRVFFFVSPPSHQPASCLPISWTL